jgi:hypothetical protein
MFKNHFFIFYLSFRIARLRVRGYRCRLLRQRLRLLPPVFVAELALQERDAALRFGLRNVVEIEIDRSGVFGSKHVDVFEDARVHHLLLPGDGDGASAELQVEGVVLRIETDSFYR